MPGRTQLDWPADVAAMADALGLDAFPVVAHSGGCGYALACAWKLPGRVRSVRLVSAVPSRAIAARGGVPLKIRLSMGVLAAMPHSLVASMFRRVARDLERTQRRRPAIFCNACPRPSAPRSRRRSTPRCSATACAPPCSKAPCTWRRT